MIDDVRYYWPVLMATEKLKIETISFQHGHFTKYHVGWLKINSSKYLIPTPDKFVVWSIYWKNELIRLKSYFKEEGVFLASKGTIDTNKKVELRNNKSQKNILIPYETDAPKDEIYFFIKNLSEMNDLKIFFKVRTDIAKNIQVEDYGISDLDIKIVSTTEGINFDLVLGVYSTFLYDMIESLTPVGIMQTSMDYGMGMIENGVADLVRTDVDLRSQIDKIIETDDSCLVSRYLKVYNSPESVEEFFIKEYQYEKN